MAMEYFCFFNAYREKIKNLSDQEVGRLVRALSLYNETGEITELKGREAIAFDFIAADIDNATQKYEAKCETNRRNREQSIMNAIRENATNDNDRERPSTNDNDREQNKKQKPKNNIVTSPPYNPPPSRKKPIEPSFESPAMEAAFRDWVAYKLEHGFRYKEIGQQNLVSQLRRYVSERGEDAVIDAIRYSISQGYKGIYFPDPAKPGKPAAQEKPSSDRTQEELEEWLNEVVI